jgi:hypothetical protein
MMDVCAVYAEDSKQVVRKGSQGFIRFFVLKKMIISQSDVQYIFLTSIAFEIEKG